MVWEHFERGRSVNASTPTETLKCNRGRASQRASSAGGDGLAPRAGLGFGPVPRARRTPGRRWRGAVEGS